MTAFNHSMPMVNGIEAPTTAVDKIMVLVIDVFQTARSNAKSVGFVAMASRCVAPSPITLSGDSRGRTRGTKSIMVLIVIF